MKRLACLVAFALAGGSGDLTSAAPSALTPLLGAAPVYREIKDWVLACDNTRVCFAKYDPADDGAAGGYLSIARDAGPAGAVTVTLETVDDAALPDPRTLTLDGRPLAVGGWALDKTEQTATLTGGPALAFIRSIGAGKALAYSDGQAKKPVSLSGLTAVLLAMDEDQGRLDGHTALARPGPRPAAAVPAALPVPVIHGLAAARPLAGAAAFAARVRKSQAALLSSHDCEAETARDDEADALNDADAIVLLGCAQGAYQSSVLVFRAPRSAPQQARLLVMPLQPTVQPTTGEDQYRGEYVAEGGWDAKSATFAESAKGRGLADCGQSTEWTFDGRDFHVASFSRLDRCGGGPPGDWPTLYRTRPVLTK